MSDNDLEPSEAYLDACFSDEIGRDVLLSLHRLSTQLQTDNEAIDVTAIIDESLTAFHGHQQEMIYEKIKRSNVLRNAMAEAIANEELSSDNAITSASPESHSKPSPVHEVAKQPTPKASIPSPAAAKTNSTAEQQKESKSWTPAVSLEDDAEELDELIYSAHRIDSQIKASATESASENTVAEAEDEWVDDDDTGYFFVKISENEFEHLEELAIRNKQVAKKLSADIQSWEQADKELRKHELDTSKTHSPMQKKAASLADDDDDIVPNSLRVDDGASSRRELSICSEDDMALSNEIPAPVPTSSVVSVHDDMIAEELAMRKLLSNGSFGDALYPPSTRKSSSTPMASSSDTKKKFGYEINSRPRRGYYFPSSPNSISSEKKAEVKAATDILGQSHLRGVDGSVHSYFNLKVIFEPNTTGFEDKDFSPPKGSIIAGRYQVKEVLGQAAFSTALQCIDLESSLYSDEDQWVCLKVIKNKKDFFDQSIDEIKLLQLINSCGDPDKYNVIRLIDYFYFKEHLFIVSELLKENLYEFGKYVRDSQLEPYFTLPRLKKITRQVLEALEYIHSLNLIHCDLKPENIVIKSYSRCEVKLIDFGSSCFTTDYLSTYIQSRSYRAPEVVLGHPYDGRIDIWSLGAVAAEMYTGYVLFQNDSLASMLARIIGIIGNFPTDVLENGRETPKYFTADNSLVYEKSENGEIMLIYPKKTTLASRLHLVDELPTSSSASLSEEALFIDFVAETLLLHPQQRPTATQALKHRWLQGAYDIDFARLDSVYAAQPVPDEDEEEEAAEEAGDDAEEEDDGEYEDVDDEDVDEEADEVDDEGEEEEEDLVVDHSKVYYDSTTFIQGSVYEMSYQDAANTSDEEYASPAATTPNNATSRSGHNRDSLKK